MKMLQAVVANEYAQGVCVALSRAGYPFTIIPCKGGFLGTEQEMMQLAVNDVNVGQVVTIIKENSHPAVREVPDVSLGEGHSAPEKVQTDGAIIFVTDIDRFYRL